MSEDAQQEGFGVTVKEREARVRETLGEVNVLDEANADLQAGRATPALEKLSTVRAWLIETAPPVPVSLAGRLLSLSVPTVREWAANGVLEEVSDHPKCVSLQSIQRVKPIVSELQSLGRRRGLLELVLARLEDEPILEDERLTRSLEEMRRGEKVVLRNKA